MPLLAYSLTDDERLLALTAFVIFAPWLVLALPVGVLVDHFDRRMLMITANVARVGLFGVIALTAGADSITIAALMSLLVVIGTCEVVFDSSAQAFLPMMVGAADLPRANGYLFAAEVVTGSILGLSVGAFLFDVDSASVRGQRGVVRRGRDPDRVDQGRTHASPAQRQCTRPRGAECTIGSAFRSLWDDRLLRLLAIMFDRHQLRVDVRSRHLRQVRRSRVGSDRFRVRAVACRHRDRRRWPGVFGHRMIAALGTRRSIVVPYLAFGVDAGLDRCSPGHRCRGCRRVRARRRDHVVEHRHPVDPPTRDRAGAVRARQQRVPLDRYRGRRLRSIGRRSTRVRDGQPAPAVPRGRRHHARRACPLRHSGPDGARERHRPDSCPRPLRRPHRR